MYNVIDVFVYVCIWRLMMLCMCQIFKILLFLHRNTINIHIHRQLMRLVAIRFACADAIVTICCFDRIWYLH